jgi:transposase InsO family protein
MATESYPDPIPKATNLPLSQQARLSRFYLSGSDEFLNGEILYTLKEARVLIEMWRRHYNLIRPHSSLGYRPPAPEAIWSTALVATS